MGEALRVPGEFVRYLHRGLFDEWGVLSTDIGVVATERGSRAGKEFYDGRRQACGACCAYLDALGWSESGLQGDVEIDLALAPEIVVNALQGRYLAQAEQLAETQKAMTRASYDAISARVQALGEFVEAVQRQAQRLSPQIPEDPVAPPTVSPRRHRPGHSSQTRCPGH